MFYANIVDFCHKTVKLKRNQNILRYPQHRKRLQDFLHRFLSSACAKHWARMNNLKEIADNANINKSKGV
ncbi:hypothetical protein A4244_11345 [Bacillus badius]|nr:hypothetical protein A4244_11345 [Bacillus badius]OCS82429.1 hypothetical protein A6M11_11355 [Bacillus badius]OVE50926.1 hypothetical protein B1A98_14005 [Bacillus badius]